LPLIALVRGTTRPTGAAAHNKSGQDFDDLPLCQRVGEYIGLGCGGRARQTSRIARLSIRVIKGFAVQIKLVNAAVYLAAACPTCFANAHAEVIPTASTSTGLFSSSAPTLT
jgi:hypothetical protein